MQTAGSYQQPQFRFKSAVRFMDLFIVTCLWTFLVLFLLTLMLIVLMVVFEAGMDTVIEIFLGGTCFNIFLTLISCSIASGIAYPMYKLAYSIEVTPQGIVMRKSFIDYVIPFENIIDAQAEETTSMLRKMRLGRWSSGAVTSKVVWLKLSSLDDLPLMTRFYSRNDNRVALDVNDPQGFLDAYMLMQQMRMQSFSMMTPMPFYMPKIPLMSERTKKGL